MNAVAAIARNRATGMSTVLNRWIKQINDASLIATAREHGLDLAFRKDLARTAGFDAFLDQFVDYLAAHWSQEQPSIQFWAYGPTKGCKLVPLSEDEETMDMALDCMPEFLPKLAERVGATRCHYVSTGDLPGYPEVLVICDIGIGCDPRLGWLEIKRDCEGNERLGPTWRSIAADDELYSDVASSPLVRHFAIRSPPRSKFLARTPTSLRSLLRSR